MPTSPSPWAPRATLALGFIPVAGLMPLALWMVFRYVPTTLAANGQPNPVQRIFYFHVPSAMMTFLCVGVVSVCAIGYLVTRRRGWERVAAAGTEVGFLFCTIVLVTGPIWAKPEWGRAWTWEPRLNFTAILWLMFLGSLLVRAFSDNRDQGARFAAVLALVSVPVVVLVYKSVELWGGVHPQPTLFRERAHDPRISNGFFVCLTAFAALAVWLIAARARLAGLEERIDDLRAAADAQDLSAGGAA